MQPSSSTGDKPSLWACQGSDQHLAGSLSSDEDMSAALGGAGSVFPPWPGGDNAACFMYFTWLTGETCPVCPAGCRVLIPPGSRSWPQAPGRGQSRAITRGHPWIEMCLCTGRSLSLMSYQAGLETFRRRGMCSSPLKPAQWGLPVLVLPKLGRCLCREAPVLPCEPQRPLSSLPAFLLLHL